MTKLYSERSNCVRAARADLGKHAQPDVDFRIIGVVQPGGKKAFRYEPIEKPAKISKAAAVIGAIAAQPAKASEPTKRGPKAKGAKTAPAEASAPAPTESPTSEPGKPASEPKAERPKAGPGFGKRNEALADARRHFGTEAKEGEDFVVFKTGARGEWFWMEKAEFDRQRAKANEGNGRSPRSGPATRSAAKSDSASGEVAPRMRASTREAFEKAEKGVLPEPPDFKADTHTRFRPKLAELVALVKAKDIAGLEAYPIKPISTSPKAMDRYRNLAVIALKAKAAKTADKAKADA